MAVPLFLYIGGGSVYGLQGFDIRNCKYGSGYILHARHTSHGCFHNSWGRGLLSVGVLTVGALLFGSMFGSRIVGNSDFR